MEIGELWCRPLWKGSSGWVYEDAAPGGPAATTELSKLAARLGGEELHAEPTIHPKVRDHIQGVQLNRKRDCPS